jgi:hypothetical protein
VRIPFYANFANVLVNSQANLRLAKHGTLRYSFARKSQDTVQSLQNENSRRKSIFRQHKQIFFYLLSYVQVQEEHILGLMRVFCLDTSKNTAVGINIEDFEDR